MLVSTPISNGVIEGGARRAKILLVTYHFPPGGGVGVRRPLALCKYLRRLGHEIFVLTSVRPVTHVYDAELLNTIPPGTQVFRAHNPEVPYAWKELVKRILRRSDVPRQRVPGPPAQPSLVRWVIERLSFPDPQKAWVAFATRKAFRIIEENEVDTAEGTHCAGFISG